MIDYKPEDYINKVVIVANGKFPKKFSVLNILRTAKQIICCDGGANKLLLNGFTPSVIIGDIDSISKENKQKFKEKIIKINDQETNDLTKAVNWCVENNIDSVVIIGATGNREDHTIGNVFLLPSYLQKIKVSMFTDYGVYFPINQPTQFRSYKGQQISIFPAEYNSKVTTHNLKYPLNKANLTELWQGTLNESLGTSFEIETNNKYIVYCLF